MTKNNNNIKAGLFTTCPEFLQTAELKSCINLYVRNRENQLVWTNCPLPLSPARIHPSQLAWWYQELPSLAQHTSCLWLSHLAPLENTTGTSALRLLFEELGLTNRSPPHLLEARNPTGHLLRFETCDKCTSYEQATDVSFCLANASAIFQLIVNHHWSVNSLLCGLAKLPINQPD